MIIAKVNNKIYKLKAYFFFTTSRFRIRILSPQDTLSLVLKGNNIIRFGDGEFRLMFDESIGFQESNRELAKQLSSILNVGVPNTVLCVPYIFIKRTGYSVRVIRFWAQFMYKYFSKLKKAVIADKVYGDAFITRVYSTYDLAIADQVFSNIKNHFLGKKILIVEGMHTKFGWNNNLLANASCVKRILCPSQNAFRMYPEILSTVRRHIAKFDIVIFAVGPTSKLLISDLADFAGQLLDLGHLDIEYEWYHLKALKKVRIEGKWVNEVDTKQGGLNDLSFDERLADEVLCII